MAGSLNSLTCFPRCKERKLHFKSSQLTFCGQNLRVRCGDDSSKQIHITENRLAENATANVSLSQRRGLGQDCQSKSLPRDKLLKGEMETEFQA